MLEILHACARGELASVAPLRRRAGAALTVVAAAQGYPGPVAKGSLIDGVEGDDDRGAAIVFHAGTRLDDSGQIVTNGGRVLAVTGLGADLATARRAAYDALHGIRFLGMFFRTDIGARGLAAGDSVPAAQGRSSG